MMTRMTLAQAAQKALLGIFGSGAPTEIVPGLWQGGYPRHGLEAVRDAGFNVLVLSAKELLKDVPDAYLTVPGLVVVRAPLDDSDELGPSENEARIAQAAAEVNVRALRAGQNVLTTCAQGRNRSGLINALTLRELRGISGGEARWIVQQKRPNALTNRGFCKFLDALPSL
jgi:hypothetical protein